MNKIKFVVVAINAAPAQERKEAIREIAPLSIGELDPKRTGGILVMLVEEEQLENETFKGTLNRLREKYIEVLKAESVTLKAI